MFSLFVVLLLSAAHLTTFSCRCQDRPRTRWQRRGMQNDQSLSKSKNVALRFLCCRRFLGHWRAEWTGWFKFI